MVWVVIRTGINLLIICPKQVGILFGVVVAVVAGVFLYSQAEGDGKQEQRDAVLISVGYGTSACSEEYPLLARGFSLNVAKLITSKGSIARAKSARAGLADARRCFGRYVA